jgi:hypothetical protein
LGTPPPSRVTEAERLGIPWRYWDLATDFAAFDGVASHEPVRAALLD